MKFCAAFKCCLQHHAFARFVLPVKSTAFSEQQWPGKKVTNGTPQDNEHPKKRTEAIQSKLSDMSPKDKRFLEQLLEEMNVQQSWQNNDGRPVGELKLLDEDALEQLESCLSVDDQSVYVPGCLRTLTYDIPLEQHRTLGSRVPLGSYVWPEHIL